MIWLESVGIECCRLLRSCPTNNCRITCIFSGRYGLGSGCETNWFGIISRLQGKYLQYVLRAMHEGYVCMYNSLEIKDSNVDRRV